MTIATIKKEIKDLKNALNTNLDEKFKVKLREQLSKSEKTLAEMESAKTPTAKKTATKKANVVAKKSTSVLQKVKQANKKAEPKKSTPAKKSTAKQPSALQKIKNQVKLNKNLSGYKKSGIDLLRDGNRPALPSGKRISKDGNPYYEYRLNRVDVRQPSKKVAKPNKLEEGGMMDKAKYNLSFNYNPSVVKNTEAEKIVSKYTKDWRHDNDFDEVSFFVMGLTMDKAKELESELMMEDAYNIEIAKSRYADGGMMAKGGRLNVSILEALNGYNNGLTLNSIAENLGLSNYRFGKYASESQMKSIKKGLEENIKSGYVEEGGIGYVITEKGARHLDTIPYEKREEGGMMAKGGKVRKGKFQAMFYTNEDDGSLIDSEYFNEYPSSEDIEYIAKSINSQYVEIYEDRHKDDSYDSLEETYFMAKGGRLKSAIMRDRAYKSNEPHEQAYTRKSRPKNPKYNYGFFADGGETEMHRAYAMGGVLQHGLETGDFIVSHDEGKMVVMNGGSKYEVNIHSGSRTKID